MRKLLITIPFLLLAATCNKQSVQVQPVQNQPAQTSPSAQVQQKPQATSTDATVNWKTYVNRSSGISIEYPQNWEFVANYKGFRACFRENGKSYPADDGSNLCAVGLGVINKKDINPTQGILSNSEEINSIVQGYGVSQQQFTKTAVTIGGVPAIIISGIGQNVFFENGNYEFVLRVSDYSAAGTGNGYEFNKAFTGVRDILNEMLKTVKFIK